MTDRTEEIARLEAKLRVDFSALSREEKLQYTFNDAKLGRLKKEASDVCAALHVAKAGAAVHMQHLAQQRFRDRGLSDKTIDALLASGIELPEQLLGMPDRDIATIPGLGRTRLAEVKHYVGRWRPVK